MTYTTIGRCRRTGQTGIAVATYSLAAGSFTQGAHGAHGVAMTQANVRKGNAPLALNLLQQGLSARSVLAALLADDEHAELRQIAVLARHGPPAVHTGAQVQGWAGARTGSDHVVFGNVLAHERVVQAMEQGFGEDDRLPLVERLLRSLEHGREAGGQGYANTGLPERSACVVVVGDKPRADWDLRVDLHPQAVQELRRLYRVFAHYQPYYEARDADPSRCLSQVAWEREHLTPHQLQEFLQ